MNERAKNVLKTMANVLTYVFLALCIVAIFLTISAKKSGDGLTILGKQFRLVVSESMEKSEFTDVSDFEIKDIPLGSLVFVEVVPEDETQKAKWYDGLKEGDVLTFRYTYTTQITITHRIVDIRDNGKGGYFIDLKGDNKTSSTSSTLEQTIDTSEDGLNYIIGKVTGQSLFLGQIITTLQTPLGMILIVILPCLAIIAYDLIKIIMLFTENKKKKAEEERTRLENERAIAMDESERQRNEIEELKRKLAALESGKIKDEKNLED